MSTRYGHSSTPGGTQDQGERKDEGWKSRQGGSQATHPGRTGEATTPRKPESQPPPGTNTQGELAGIGDASDESSARLISDAEKKREAARSR